MKKYFTVVVCIILIAFCDISSSGIYIDGCNNGTEWNDSEFYVLFNSPEQSKCDVEYTDIRVVLENDSTVSVLLQAIDSSFNEEKSAVRFGVNGKYFTLAVNGCSKYSNAEYSVNFETAKYNNDYVLEARFLFSEVVADGTEMSVIVIDGNGNPSSECIVEIHPRHQYLQPETTAKQPKTTVPKTTKPKTTKPKVTSRGSPNKSKTPDQKRFWDGVPDNKYDNTEGEEYLASEQQSETNSPRFDFSGGNIQNVQRYKVLAVILICFLLFSAAVIMAIPTLRKDTKNDSQDKNKKYNNK